MTGDRIAIIGGQGRLPVLLAEVLEFEGAAPVLAAMEQFPIEGAGARAVDVFRVERLAPFLDRLHDMGVGRVVFAGAVRRPQLDPALFDARSAQLVPRLLAAMQGGDDAILRAVIGVFEEDGFSVVGADEVAPDLLPEPGVLTRAGPSEADIRDAGRAAEIVAALGTVDVGQGAVVTGGLCLAVEALPGTDAMLSQVAQQRGESRGGVFYKAPKPGQERRMDLPALGPDTVDRAVEARLSGIAFEAGGVILLDREIAVARADAAGLFLWSRQG